MKATSAAATGSTMSTAITPMEKNCGLSGEDCLIELNFRWVHGLGVNEWVAGLDPRWVIQELSGWMHCMIT